MAHVEVGAEIMTPPAKPEVEVLLATYYGERFLREQIDSILAQDYAQDYPALRILAGTTAPATAPPTILAEYASQFPGRIRVMPDAHPTGGQDQFSRIDESCRPRLRLRIRENGHLFILR